MFVYFSLLAYFRHVPPWFPVVSLHEVHRLSPKMQGKKLKKQGYSVLGFYLQFCNFEVQGIMPYLVSETW